MKEVFSAGFISCVIVFSILLLLQVYLYYQKWFWYFISRLVVLIVVFIIRIIIFIIISIINIIITIIRIIITIF